MIPKAFSKSFCYCVFFHNFINSGQLKFLQCLIMYSTYLTNLPQKRLSRFKELLEP